MTFEVGDRVEDQWSDLGRGTVQEVIDAGITVKFDNQLWPKFRVPESLKISEDREEFEDRVSAELDKIAELLISKNRKYGDSALNPVRTFSKADSVEQIKVRIDDKLSRIQRGQGDDEDTVTDLIGYLIMLKIAEAQ